jgi:hypothetical protein
MEGALCCRDFNGVAVQRRASDGYFNAAEMCKGFDTTFKDYARRTDATDFLDALARSISGDFEEVRAGLVQVRKGGAHRGSWVHERLAVDLARWLSPEFSLWIEAWVLEPPGPVAQDTDLRRQLAQLLGKDVTLIGNIRKTDTSKISVIDIVQAMSGKDGRASAEDVRIMIARFPEVDEKLDHFKFPGRGQRDTPVADLSTIVEIIFLLPGRPGWSPSAPR